MSKSVVNIESLDKNNRSFGTGFVIDNDEHGVYILTCKHVLDDVKNPMVDEVKARIVAVGKEIDMAVIYVSKLQLPPLSLQIDACESRDVKVIGFSNFNQNMTQKKHICATLFEEHIELHSNQYDFFYQIRKIKTHEGYTFDRGNSGSPVFCRKTNRVIAMISNKEGNEIGYAIEIKSLGEIWKEMPSHILDLEEVKIEEISGKKPEPKINILPQKTLSLSITKKIYYAILLLLSLVLGTIFYLFFAPLDDDLLSNEPPEKIELERHNGSNIEESISVPTKSRTIEFSSNGAEHECIRIYIDELTIEEKNKEFSVLHQDRRLFSFKHIQGAKRAIFIMKSYNLTKVCSIGRNETEFGYMLSENDAPQGEIDGEECMGFHYKYLLLEKTNNYYELMNDDYSMFDFSHKDEAEEALKIIKKYKFRHFCYIQNPESQFKYFKK